MSMNDQVGGPATAVAMELSQEERERRRVRNSLPPTFPGFYWVMDQHDGQIVVWARWSSDSADRLQASLEVLVPGSNTVWRLDAERFMSWGERAAWPKVAPPGQSLDEVMQRGLVQGEQGQTDGTPGKGAETVIAALPGRLVLRAEDGQPARLGKPGRKGAGFRLSRDGDDLVVQVVSPLEEATGLNELDVRHIVASELARVMLSQVLISENSQLVVQARQYQERAGKLDHECAELHKKLSDLNVEAQKWKADAQRWANDYLHLARRLGVPDHVRDRTIVEEAVKRADELLAKGQEASVDMAEQIFNSALLGFEGVKVHVTNLREVAKRRFDELRAGGAT